MRCNLLGLGTVDLEAFVRIVSINQYGTLRYDPENCGTVDDDYDLLGCYMYGSKEFVEVDELQWLRSFDNLKHDKKKIIRSLHQ